MKLYISPGQYVAGYDNILELGKYIEKFGNKVLFLSDETMMPCLKEKMKIINKESKFNVKYEFFNG